MGVDYGEILCTAVDEIVTTRLAGLSYDLTKLCTIVDDSYAYQGKYVVSDGTARYEAFTTDNSLTKGNNVLVTIPNGNYNLQKIIKGRVAATDTTPFKYQSPLKTMIKVTNDILNGPQATDVIENKGLLANGNETLLGPIYSIKNATKLSGYTRFGISADFRSLLDGLDVVSGTYGLKILVHGQTVVRPGEYNQQVFELDFNSSDMVGNPYQFGIYFTQEKVFDISFINNIEDIEVYFFQGNNFIDGSGERISTINVTEMNNFKNLFVDNVQIYLGYDINEFDKETLMLHTDDILSYQYTQDNEKDVYLRWIHLEEDQSPVMVNSDDVKEGARKKVKWYRYSPGCENIDKYGGKNWEPVTADTSNALHYNFIPDIKKKTEQIKAIGFIYSNEKVGEENIKQAYYSNILIFENEEDVPDKTTKDASVGLTIECLDDSEGNYFIYNQNGKINNEGLGQGYERRFKAMFNGAEITGSLGTLDWIKWYIPEEGQTKSSMILTNDEQRTENNGKVLKNGAQYRTNSYWEITRRPKEKVIPQEFTSVEQAYCISNQWTIQKFNNLVICRASINGVEYEAKKQLNFGKAGTNGTNLTLVMEFTENQNALIINDQKIQNSDGKETYKENTITVNTYIYDNAEGKIQAILNPNDVKYSWYRGYHLKTDPKTKKQVQVNPYIDLAKSSIEGSVEAILTCKTSILPEDNYSILQVKYNDLTAYLPIPLKTRDTSFMEGAREIIYNHQGVPSYYTGRYLLHYFDIFQKKYDKYNDTDYKKIEGKEEQQYYTKWKIKNNENTKVDETGKNSALSQSYRPALHQLASNLDGFGLLAPPFFAENFTNEVCVSIDDPKFKYYKKNELGDNEGDPVEIHLGWSQPILMMQSKYDFALLNKWDGSLTLDEEKGTILSAMLGAGRKNSNNTFSGVLIGDVKAGTGLDTMQEATGVYGIHEGQLSYGLRDNGTGFIGKSGHGQILLDGNKGKIKSAGYDNLNNAGTLFDLDEGKLDMRFGQGRITLQAKHAPYLLVKSIKGTPLINIGLSTDNTSNFIQSDANDRGSVKLDLTEGSFDIKSNGILEFLVDSTPEPNGAYFKIAVPNADELANNKFSNDLFYLSSEDFYLQSKEFNNKFVLQYQNDDKDIFGNYYKYEGTIKFIYYTTDENKTSTLAQNNYIVVTSSGEICLASLSTKGEYSSDGIILNFKDYTVNSSIKADDGGSITVTTTWKKAEIISYIQNQSSPIFSGTNKPKGFKLDLNKSKITGYDLYLSGTNSRTGQSFLLYSGAETYPFLIGNNFKIDWNGSGWVNNWTCNNLKVRGNSNIGGNTSIDLGEFHIDSDGNGSGYWNGEVKGVLNYGGKSLSDLTEALKYMVYVK